MRNSLIYKIFGQLICMIATVLFLFPLVLMLIRSFGGSGIYNYVKVFKAVNLAPNFGTSLIVVFGTLLIVSLVATMAAFAFSKLEFAYKKIIYYIVLTGMMIPTSALIFPLFQIVKGMGLNNTPFSLILPYATLNCCFNLMILKNYFDSLPNELLEAAKIDGAGTTRTFSTIMMPLAIPGLAFVLIQTFLSAWNELQMALIFINDTKVQPISVIPLRFTQTAGVQGFPLEVMFAALVVCLFPIAVFYIFGSRFLITGLTQGAIKG
ncbi:ABC transporter permease subunit [Anaerocolumna sedimenticola]|uniref:ABC transporter permease subunit n=1 Tax=Anaerocolumna sedimenticola TaxID=2696063 RepID=A0A6P1TTI0_9FIRM|nr:carbohydrate ABC transporter permease [Anaerocolumna sedimenticola]QHQ63707.1 ABC transporter permease subunit [Anaerocolumna sedimenticola]